MECTEQNVMSSVPQVRATARRACTEHNQTSTTQEQQLQWNLMHDAYLGGGDNAHILYSMVAYGPRHSLRQSVQSHKKRKQKKDRFGCVAIREM